MTLLRIFRRLRASKDKAIHISLFCPGFSKASYSVSIEAGQNLECQNFKSRLHALQWLQNWSNQFDVSGFKYYTFYDMENMFSKEGMQVVKFTKYE